MSTATQSDAHAVADPSSNGAAGGERPSASLAADTLKGMLYDMMLIRRFEEKTMQSYQQAKIGGFCHIYIGQEATAVGAVAALNGDDPVIGAYRDHGLALARGMNPDHCMAEMYGKLTGCAKGKGGSMHMFDRPNAMFGGHAIVGGQCPLGAGIAWGIQYNRESKVCLCFLGDGALNQGAFFESMNIAAVYNLPIIFVLENNNYSMGTHINRGTAMADELRVKAESFGMRYAECDGQDVLDTYDCFMDQVPRTRDARPINYNEDTGQRDELPTYNRDGREQGPAFINVKTYRYQGHSMSDPQKYRSKEEVGQYKNVDCINRLVNNLIDRDIATQEECDDLDKKAKDAATAAIEFAENSDEPTRDNEMFTDVYVNPYQGLDAPPYQRGQPHPDYR